MTNNLLERPTAGERYLSATASGDLSPGGSDADALLAAAWAATGDPRKILALSLWRLRATDDHTALGVVLDESRGWLSGRLHRGGRKTMRRTEQEAVCALTLRWWIAPQCLYCSAKGQLEHESGTRLSGHTCPACAGTKVTPLAHVIAPHYLEHARWLADQYDSLAGMVFGAMAQQLNSRMDL